MEAVYMAKENVNTALGSFKSSKVAARFMGEMSDRS